MKISLSLTTRALDYAASRAASVVPAPAVSTPLRIRSASYSIQLVSNTSNFGKYATTFASNLVGQKAPSPLAEKALACLKPAPQDKEPSAFAQQCLALFPPAPENEQPSVKVSELVQRFNNDPSVKLTGK